MVRLLVFNTIIIIRPYCFLSLPAVTLVPLGNVTVCPGDNATFTCMTTGGALLWETGSPTQTYRYDDDSQSPTQLGIFQLRVLRVASVGNVIVGVNSAATATNIQPADNRVTLDCQETTNSSRVQAVLNIAGRLHAMCYM